MAAIDDLKTAFETEIAKISNDLSSKMATYKLDAYIAALEKQTAMESNEIQSYTIAGRTITRRNVSEGKAAVAALEADLMKLIYGSKTLMDMNTNVSQP